MHTLSLSRCSAPRHSALRAAASRGQRIFVSSQLPHPARGAELARRAADVGVSLPGDHKLMTFSFVKVKNSLMAEDSAKTAVLLGMVRWACCSAAAEAAAEGGGGKGGGESDEEEGGGGGG